jgi:acyl transferase domain-containing protein
MREGVLPKTLHVDAPSSKVDWESGEIKLLSEQLPWDGNGKPRRAGVSSFGISGTNAHVILEEAPELEPAAAGEQAGDGGEAPAPLPGQVPLVLSAKAEPALAEAAGRLADHLQENADLDPTDIAYSLAATRSAFRHRAVVLGQDRKELLAALTSLAEGTPSPNLITAKAGEGKLAYLLTGQGSQRLGMGRELYETDPHFKEAFDRACEELGPHLDTPLEDTVFAKGKKAAALLEDTTHAQPALFAIEVALHEALAKRGLSPDVLAGHSVGEIAAAHIAGVFELSGAARLVAARGRLMGALPAGGVMAAIEATETEATGSIEGRESDLALAAINGPKATVISGTEEAVEDVRARWEEQGRKTKRLAVSHAFHSPLMEPMLGEFAEVAESLTYREPKIPVVSNVTGEVLSAEEATDPAYWVAHARQPVRFADAIETLHEQGASTYMELGPDPVLCAVARECLGEEGEAAFIPTLREGRPEAGALTIAIAHAHAAGAKVGWGAFFGGTGAKRVPLPTYPFQRTRYWLASTGGVVEASAVGQGDAGHPLLGAAVGLAGDSGQGILLTGRISLSTHPWLRDHAVGEAVLLPGGAFLELALRAAEEAGAETVGELTVKEPLVLPGSGAMALQVSVSGPGEEGQRQVTIHSRPGDEEGEWALNASGTLSEGPAPAPEPLGAWPPEGAEELDATYLYDVLAEQGLGYSPAFQGLKAAWRDGESICAEVALPEEQGPEAERFAIHPALLEAALHAAALADGGASANAALPAAWHGVSVHAVGARELRVRLAPGQEGEHSLALASASGAPVATIGSLALRPPSPEQLQAQGRRPSGLLGLQWAEIPLAGQEGTPPGVELLHCEPSAGTSNAEAAQKAAEEALEAIQRWLGDESKEGMRLALLTEGAVAAGEGESPDPAAAAVWGLTRSAISEHPGRFALIDTDGTEASEAALPAALSLSGEEPQLALREGAALAPRLTRMSEGDGEVPAMDPERTVLITGATGALGALVARHLAGDHGARHLLLVSRGGEGAEGAEGLKAELEGLGARVRIAACDVSDKEALEALFEEIPTAHPLGAVVHCAGTIADGTVETLGPEQIEQVFAAKAQGAQNLHELAEGSGLSAFVLFSSVAGTLGGPGQANYAAANAFLDALAQKRQAEGLPATSIAWGLWQRESGMAGGLSEADMARMRRGGTEPLADEHGLALFDAALMAGRPGALAVPIDTASLRALASAGVLPPLFHGLIRMPRKRVQAAGVLTRLLAERPEAEHEGLVLELVRSQVATVLGHASPHEVEPQRAFQEMGLDSLAAVELRNRLSVVAGLQLPATVVFDYPSAAGIAAKLLAEAGAGAEGGEEPGELEVRELLMKLETTLSSLEPADGVRERASTRLRALLVSLSDPDSSEAGGSAEDLASMSHEEMFELIDEEFGGREGPGHQEEGA